MALSRSPRPKVSLPSAASRVSGATRKRAGVDGRASSPPNVKVSPGSAHNTAWTSFRQCKVDGGVAWLPLPRTAAVKCGKNKVDPGLLPNESARTLCAVLVVWQVGVDSLAWRVSPAEGLLGCATCHWK